MENKSNPAIEDAVRAGKLVHLALPVRWSLVGQQSRGALEMACTYDIHQHGARLLSSRSVTVGDLLMVERGRNKVICQVIWAGASDSPLRGQFSVRCVEGRAPWDDELRQIEEHYQPVILDGAWRGATRSLGPSEANRRRRPRFFVEGQAEVIDGAQRVSGEIQQISEYGARIAATETLRPGTDFRLMLNMFDISVALKAEVKYRVDNLGMGVEFQEIRRGDRPLLSYILNKLRTEKLEDFVEVEVAQEELAAALG